MAVIEETLLWDEVKRIMNDPEQPVYHMWSATIHCGDVDVVPIRVMAYENSRDYGRSFGDAILIEVAVGAGQYNSTIFKSKDNLTVTVSKTPTGTMDSSVTPPDDIEIKTYRGILLETTSEIVTPTREFNDDAGAMDVAGILKIRIQLLDFALEQLLSKSISFAAKNSKPGGCVRYILTKLSKEIDVKEEYAIQGVNMTDYDNTEERLVILKTGTMLLDAPTIIHEQHGGVYSAGFAFYLQNGFWYVWPRFDVTKFKAGRPTLTIIAIPENKLPSVEKTYRMVGNNIFVILTGGLRYTDPSESLKYNKGNGTRFVDSRSVMDEAEVEDNKLMLDPSITTTEYVGEERATGLNNVRVGASRITSNSFVEAGLITERQGSYIQGIWQNSDHSLLTPGMPVKYLYLKGNEVQQALGVLDAVQAYVEPIEDGLTFTRHRANTSITAFIAAKLDWRDDVTIT